MQTRRPVSWKFKNRHLWQEFEHQYREKILFFPMRMRNWRLPCRTKKGLTPADVTTYLLHDLQTKEPKQVWQENGRIALRYEDTSEEGNVVKEVYLHPDSFALAEAHIYNNNGKQIMDCTVQSCTLQP